LLRATVAATALLLAAGAVRAQSCTLNTVSGVSFGSYDALETGPLDQTGSVTFECDVLFLGTVAVDVSTGSSGTFAFREMRNGGHSLRYNLFLDATRSQIWGDGTSESSRFGPALPLLGIPQTLTIYGRIPARQSSPVGAYTDTVTATINF
jgi:spore coat protein U-like protein